MQNKTYTHIRSMLQEQKAAPPGDITRARAALDDLLGRYQPPEGIRVEPAVVAGMSAEWLSDGDSESDRVILYIHGGAYTRGSLLSHRGLAARLAAASEARALVFAYRLAPEHQFPAAIEDSLAVYRWLLKSGIRPERLVIAGDSAGGGLALGTLLTLRGEGGPLPAGAALLSPWTDLTGSHESIKTNAEVDPWINVERLGKVAGLYLGGADPRTPLASPVYADLHGLPPLLVQVGTDEILFDDATVLAERARAAGVEVTLQIWQGMWHVFQAFASEVPEGQQAIDEIGSFVREVAGQAVAPSR